MAKNEPVSNELSTMDYLTEDSNGGFQDLTPDTTSFPFLRILQKQSPALNELEPEYVEGAKAGMFLNTGTNSFFASPLRVVVGRFDRYYCEWRPNRGGFVRQWTVAEVNRGVATGEITSDRYKLITNEGNELSETYVYYCLLPDYPDEGVVMLSMSSTQLKEARKWNRMMMSTNIPGTNRRAAPYFIVWSLSTFATSNQKGSWYGVSVKFDSFVDKEMFEVVKEARLTLPDRKVDMSAIEEAQEKPAINVSDVPF